MFADSPVLISESSTHGTIFSSLDSNKEITLKCKFDGFPVPELKFQFAGVNLNSISNASGFVSYKFRVTHYIEVYERGEFKFLKRKKKKENGDRTAACFAASFASISLVDIKGYHFTVCAA